MHADSNGYTNLPDVVQPSHSPTESSKGQSPPLKEGGSDVSGWWWLYGARRDHWPWTGDAGALGHCGWQGGALGSWLARVQQEGWARVGVWHICLTATPTPQYQSRGLVKAPGKSSFTMFVDLGIYQPGGSGDTIPITGETGGLGRGRVASDDRLH